MPSFAAFSAVGMTAVLFTLSCFYHLTAPAVTVQKEPPQRLARLTDTRDSKIREAQAKYFISAVQFLVEFSWLGQRLDFIESRWQIWQVTMLLKVGSPMPTLVNRGEFVKVIQEREAQYRNNQREYESRLTQIQNEFCKKLDGVIYRGTESDPQLTELWDQDQASVLQQARKYSRHLNWAIDRELNTDRFRSAGYRQRTVEAYGSYGY